MVYVQSFAVVVVICSVCTLRIELQLHGIRLKNCLLIGSIIFFDVIDSHIFNVLNRFVRVSVAEQKTSSFRRALKEREKKRQDKF